MIQAPPKVVDIRHFHIFCGLGGGARGFSRGAARVGNMVARMRCIGGVDVDPASIADFGRLAGVPGTVLDLFSREQSVAFHGREPPPGWREATPQDLQRAAGGERPHIVFLSAPCKGFSGLLSETASRTAKYQALNGLTLRGVWLMLEAWRADPPELIVFENVPRIASRGRRLLDQIVALLRSYGYAVRETKHDCGVIGGLGQSRKRFLLVARHEEKVPPFLYEPPVKRLLGVGDVLERFPLPGDIAAAGPMHRMPALQWRTWVRLAFVEAGSDWRSLNRLRVEDGMLADYGIAPDTAWHQGVLGVRRWDEPSGAVRSRSGPTNDDFAISDPRPENFPADRAGLLGVNDWIETAPTITSQRAPGQGRFSVADPRVDGHPRSVQLGVRSWRDPAAVVKGDVSVGTGPYAVADPRFDGSPHFKNVYRIVRWDSPSGTVTTGHGPSSGGVAVTDPRPADRADYKQTKYRITGYDEAAGTVIAASTTGNGAYAVADPRTGWPEGTHQSKLAVGQWDGAAKTVTGSDRVGSGALCVADPRPEGFKGGREHFEGGGHYGVVGWQQPSGTVAASSQLDNGRWSVADPRAAEGEPAERLPAPDDRLVAVIRALDGTWHRPFTTLELAALQSLVEPEEHLELEGLSDSAWRERIGNAVPPAAAEAIASTMARTLLLAWSGETFLLSSAPIWVRDVAVALSLPGATA